MNVLDSLRPSPTRACRTLSIAVAVLLGAGLAHAADNTMIQRCEAANGSITYSNGTCPSGTRQQRSIEITPSLEIVHPKGEDASSDAPDLNPYQAKPDGKAETRPLGTIERSRPKPSTAKDTAPKPAQTKVSPVKAPVATTNQGPGPAAGITHLSPTPQSDDSRAEEVEKHQQQIGVCDDLVRRIEYAQHDVDSAAEGERASAELALRRLQAEHTTQCMPPVKVDAAKKG
jgi:hypothetical protein